MSVFDKSQAQRSGWEKLLAKIPGFRGYLNKEWRRESDKIERDHVAKLFDYARNPVQRAGKKAAETGFDGMKLTAQLDALNVLIDRVANRVRFADYGYSGFFDTVKIGEPELVRMYEFDVAMLESAEELGKRCDELMALVSDPDALKSEVELLENVVRTIDKNFDQRERIITGAGAP